MLCCSCVVLEMGCAGDAGANESIAFFGERMLENGRVEGGGYWLLQGGLLLEKKE